MAETNSRVTKTATKSSTDIITSAPTVERAKPACYASRTMPGPSTLSELQFLHRTPASTVPALVFVTALDPAFGLFQGIKAHVVDSSRFRNESPAPPTSAFDTVLVAEFVVDDSKLHTAPLTLSSRRPATSRRPCFSPACWPRLCVARSYYFNVPAGDGCLAINLLPGCPHRTSARPPGDRKQTASTRRCRRSA